MVSSVALSPWFCPSGAVHQWTYLGRKRQAYRCVLCVQLITKIDLKRETDNA